MNLDEIKIKLANCLRGVGWCSRPMTFYDQNELNDQDKSRGLDERNEIAQLDHSL